MKRETAVCLCVCNLWCIYTGCIDEYPVPKENGGNEKEARPRHEEGQ